VSVEQLLPARRQQTFGLLVWPPPVSFSMPVLQTSCPQHCLSSVQDVPGFPQQVDPPLPAPEHCRPLQQFMEMPSQVCPGPLQQLFVVESQWPLQQSVGKVQLPARTPGFTQQYAWLMH
jgi:hypothetical protein